MTLFSRKGKLRDTFIFLFVLIAACPVLLLGGVALYVLSTTHRADVSRLEVEVLLGKSKIVETFIHNALGGMHIEAETLTETTIATEKGTPWQKTFATALLNDNPSFREVSFVDLQGNEVAKDAHLSAVKSLLNVSKTPQFQSALAGNDYVSDVFYTLTGPAVLMAAPVLSNGKVFQVVVAELDLSPLVASLQETHLEEGRLLLFDHRGTFVATTTIGSVRPGTNFSSWSRVQRVQEGARFDGLGKDDRYESAFLGTPVVGAGLSIPTVGWSLFVEWPLTYADAIIDRVRFEVLLITLASVAAVIFFAVIFANWLVLPIRTLEVASRNIAGGKFDEKVEIDVGNELDELGASFNTMAEGLKQLDELRTEYTHVMTHELRAPVTAIRGYVSLLMEDATLPLTQEAKGFLRVVQESADNLASLINDLLDIAKIEAGKMKVESADVDVLTVVGSAVTELSIVGREKGISLHYEALAKPVTIVADGMRLKQVVINLLSNALKYNKEHGWVKIYFSTISDSISIIVEDGGLGMTPEQLSHAFEKFYRAKNQEKIVGTGLGLYTTKLLTEAMHGKIVVESTYGIGTKFTLSFPIKKK